MNYYIILVIIITYVLIMIITTVAKLGKVYNVLFDLSQEGQKTFPQTREEKQSLSPKSLFTINQTVASRYEINLSTRKMKIGRLLVAYAVSERKKIKSPLFSFVSLKRKKSTYIYLPIFRSGLVLVFLTKSHIDQVYIGRGYIKQLQQQQ